MVVLTQLPEDTLIWILSLLQVQDIIRLRRVNRAFQALTQLLIVWINAYRDSDLLLAPLHEPWSSEDLERELIRATRLNINLSSPSPELRKDWIILVPQNLSDIYLLPGGKHALLYSYRTLDMAIVDLDASRTWELRCPHPDKNDTPLFELSAGYLTRNGQLGIVVIARDLLIKSSRVQPFFLPLDEAGNPALSEIQSLPEVVLSSEIVSGDIVSCLMIVGARGGCYTVVNLQTDERWSISHGSVSRRWSISFLLRHPYLILASKNLITVHRISPVPESILQCDISPACTKLPALVSPSTRPYRQGDLLFHLATWIPNPRTPNPTSMLYRAYRLSQDEKLECTGATTFDITALIQAQGKNPVNYAAPGFHMGGVTHTGFRFGGVTQNLSTLRQRVDESTVLILTKPSHQPIGENVGNASWIALPEGVNFYDTGISWDEQSGKACSLGTKGYDENPESGLVVLQF